MPFFSPYLRYYQSILPTTQSSGWYNRQEWKKYAPIVSGMSCGGPFGHSRNSGSILFHFCHTTPPTALERVNTFSTSSLHLSMLYTTSIIVKHGNDGMILCSRKREDSGDTDSRAVGSIWQWNAAHIDIGMLMEFNTASSLCEGI